MVSTPELLERYGLSDVTLVNESGSGVNEDIEWTQISRSFFGCKESYKKCQYHVEGVPNKKIIVFVANACGGPPDRIYTGGHYGNLHCGYIYVEKDGLSAVFFVIHPNDWQPYQHRFMQSALTSLTNGAIKSGATSMGGALAGAGVGMFFGPVGAITGAVVGGAGSFFAGAVAPSIFGDYLRHIG